MTRRSLAAAVGGVVSIAAVVAHAQDGGAEAGADEAVAAEPAPAGILPVPEYAAAFKDRAFLLGDLGGARSELADTGVQFQFDWTQHMQSVTRGGRDTDTRFGGSLEYLLKLDLDRMGVMPGGVVTARAESRYGESVNGLTGTLLPANTDLFVPLTTEIDDEVGIAVTELTYTQFLAPNFAIVLGKFNTLTLGGDPNEFASGRGLTQFQNANFVFHSLASLAPYSTLGVAAVWLPTPDVTLSGAVLNSTDSSTSSGFGDFGEGWTANAEAQFRYELDGRPGGMNIGVLVGGDGDYTELTGRVLVTPGTALQSTSDETWSVYWTGWQYLWADESDDTLIDPVNGLPDRRGFGVFARVGIADDDTLPIDWHLSVGLGGRGVIPGRPDDHFGIGYFYNSIQADRITAVDRVEDQALGLEAFYNAALSPGVQLTGSVQVIEDANAATETAVVLGGRLKITF